MNYKPKILSCKRCLYTSSHALGLTIDSEGICSGCRVHEEKDLLDWTVRWQMLQSLVAQYRVASGRTYDCIVPVTGANDSHFIVHIVKERLGLNPLLVTYNKYFNSSLGIRNLANLRIRFNCDIIIQNINPLSVKKITRSTLQRFGSIYWPCIAGQTVFPVQTAVRYKVPLIIWGAHQGMEQVGMFSHQNEVEMTRRYRKDHDLMGYEADDLLSIFDTLNESDIWQYRYPDDATLNQVGVRGIYLGNYVRWDPRAQHEQMIAEKGYEGAFFDRTFDTYDHVDCFNYLDLHDHLKFIKHGYSKVTDHATREIRHNRLSRDAGLALVRKYEGAPLRHLEKFCEWLQLDLRGLEFITDMHRNSQFWWQETKGKKWQKIKEKVEIDLNKTDILKDLGYLAKNNFDFPNEDHYITIGKGYPL